SGSNDDVRLMEHRLKNGPKDKLLVTDQRGYAGSRDVHYGIGKHMRPRSSDRACPCPPRLPHGDRDGHAFPIENPRLTRRDRNDDIVVAAPVDDGRASDHGGCNIAQAVLPEPGDRRSPKAERAYEKNDHTGTPERLPAHRCDEVTVSVERTVAT